MRAENAAQPAVQTIFQNVGTLTGPIEEAVGWLAPRALNLAKVGGPLLWGTASVIDIMAHGTCAMEADPAAANAALQSIP
jgi:hypothetical protein